MEDCGLLAGGRGGGGAGRIGWKSSELSAHQIFVGGELGQILRAELSSNTTRRIDREEPFGDTSNLAMSVGVLLEFSGYAAAD